VGAFAPDGGGTTPGERKLGQSERSSGSDVPDGDVERCDRIAAAYAGHQHAPHTLGGMGTTDLEELDLLVLALHELGGLAPVRRVLPAVLDQAARVLVLLGAVLAHVDLPALAAGALRRGVIRRDALRALHRHGQWQRRAERRRGEREEPGMRQPRVQASSAAGTLTRAAARRRARR
jgi:hypothetical protein